MAKPIATAFKAGGAAVAVAAAALALALVTPAPPPAMGEAANPPRRIVSINLCTDQ